MDEIREQFHEGRRAMIGAFAELTTLALRAGADWDAVSDLHGAFFDGNVAIKDAFRVTLFCAEVFGHKRP